MTSAAVERFLTSNDEVHEHDIRQIKDAWDARNSGDLQRFKSLSQAFLKCPLAHVDLSVLTLGICARRLPGSAVLRRLPNEIWFYIFSYIISGRTIFSMQSYVVLSLVCHRWNEIVKALRRPSPGIYTAYKIPSQNKYSWTSKDNGPFALCIPTISPERDSPLINGLTCLPAAKCLALSLSYNFLTPWLPMDFNTFSSWEFLHCLKLSIPYLSNPDDFQPSLFSSASNLKDVEIHCGSNVSIEVPHGELVRYKEHCVSNINYLHSMKNSAKLNTLDYTIIHRCYTQFLAPRLMSNLVFPGLTYFDFKVYVPPTAHMCIIKDLTLPKLTRLRVRIEQDDLIEHLKAMLRTSAAARRSTLSAYPPPPNIIDYQLKQQMQMTSLAFYTGKPLEEGQLIELLSYTPMLTYLECGSIPTSDLRALGLPTANREGTCVAPNLTSLTIHDPDDIDALSTLAKSNYLPRRPFRTILRIQLLYRDKDQRRTDGVYLGVSRSNDTTYNTLEGLVNEMTKVMRAGTDQSANSDAIRYPLKVRRELEHILETIGNIRGISPYSVPLSIIQALHGLNRAEAHLFPGPDLTNLLQRAQQLYTKLLMLYQLKKWREPVWVAPGMHCLVFEYEGRDQEPDWKPDEPSEYDLLYGKYKPPRREEVMWPYEDCYSFSDGWLFFGPSAFRGLSASN